MKFILHNINHFKVNNAVALSTFPKLCKHQLYLDSKCFYHSKSKTPNPRSHFRPVPSFLESLETSNRRAVFMVMVLHFDFADVLQCLSTSWKDLMRFIENILPHLLKYQNCLLCRPVNRSLNYNILWIF